MKKGVFIFLLLPTIIHAQAMSFSILNGVGQQKEELLQPIVYNGYQIGIGASYNKVFQNKNSIFTDVMVSGIYTAKTTFGNDMSKLNTQIEFGYLFKTPARNFTLGPSLQAQYDYALYSLNYEYPFWFTQYSLNCHLNYRFKLSENIASVFSISLPLSALISRTPREVYYETKKDYRKAYFHQDMTFESFSHFQALTISLLINKDRGPKFDYSAGYKESYFYFQNPNPISSVYHSLVISITLKNDH